MFKRALLAGISATVMLVPHAAAGERGTPVEWSAKPPVAAARPVSEDFFGTTLVDPYRYMETAGDAETLAFIKAQGSTPARCSTRFLRAPGISRRFRRLAASLASSTATRKPAGGRSISSARRVRTFTT